VEKLLTISDYVLNEEKQKEYIKTECLSWINRENETILVKNMNNQYISNCIDKIISHQWRLVWLDYFEKILIKRIVEERKRKLNKLF
jgi:hypothetical protein